MSDVILVLNAGSSSLEVHAVRGRRRTHRPVRRPDQRHRNGAPVRSQIRHGVRNAPAGTRRPRATHCSASSSTGSRIACPGTGCSPRGHRVVHGGDRFAGPVRIDAEVLAELGRLEPLAPLHQPHNLVLRSAYSGPNCIRHLPQVACFDTAFHRDPAPRSSPPSPCPATCTTRASSATASTACPTIHRRELRPRGARSRSGPRDRRPSGQRRQPVRAPTAGAALTAPWAIPRSTG